MPTQEKLFLPADVQVLGPKCLGAGSIVSPWTSQKIPNALVIFGTALMSA